MKGEVKLLITIYCIVYNNCFLHHSLLMYRAYSLAAKLSYDIHNPDSKPTKVPAPNHKLRIHYPLNLRSGQAAMPLRET